MSRDNRPARVIVTVRVIRDRAPSQASMELLIDPAAYGGHVMGGVGRVIADAARVVGERAYFGVLLPTPAKEGGRG